MTTPEDPGAGTPDVDEIPPGPQPGGNDTPPIFDGEEQDPINGG